MFFLWFLYCSFREPVAIHAFPDLRAVLNKQIKHKLMLAAKFRWPKKVLREGIKLSLPDACKHHIEKKAKAKHPSPHFPTFLPFILFFSFFHSLSLFCSFFPFFVQRLMKISKTCASQMVELPPAPPASHPTTMHKPILSCTCPQKLFVFFWKNTQSDVLGTSAVQEPGWLVLPPFLRLIDGCFLTGRQ